MSTHFCKYLVLILTCTTLLPGCSNAGSSSSVPNTIDQEDGLANAQLGLTEMAELFKFFAGESIKPPKKAAEFAKYDAGFPTAGVLLPAGKIVYAGGSLDKSAPPKILGYEKNAPTAGGWVLLTNGDVKQLTADEFKSLLPSSK